MERGKKASGKGDEGPRSAATESRGSIPKLVALAGKAFTAIGKVVACFFRPGVTREQRSAGLIGVLAFVLIFLAVAGAITMPAAHRIWPILMGLLGLILLTTLHMIAPLLERRARPVKLGEPRSRLVPKLDLPELSKRELGKQIDGLRKAAFDWFTEPPRSLKVDYDQVRANVFLARYKDPGVDAPFVLCMDQALSRGVKGDRELNLRFMPFQGATGLAFSNGVAEPAVRDPATDEWEDRHHLTEQQKKDIHQDLKWVLSMPALHPQLGTSLAVVNVDGLRFNVEPTHLEELHENLRPRMDEIAKTLADCPAVRIEISVEECDAPASGPKPSGAST